jgi:hypothetical protein
MVITEKMEGDEKQKEGSFSEFFEKNVKSETLKEVFEDGFETVKDKDVTLDNLKPFISRTLGRLIPKEELGDTEDTENKISGACTDAIESVFGMMKDIMARADKYASKPYLAQLPSFFRILSLQEGDLQEDALIISSMMDGTEDIVTLYDDPEFKARVLNVAVALQKKCIDLMKAGLAKLEEDMEKMDGDADVDFLLRTIGERLIKK